MPYPRIIHTHVYTHQHLWTNKIQVAFFLSFLIFFMENKLWRDDNIVTLLQEATIFNENLNENYTFLMLAIDLLTFELDFFLSNRSFYQRKWWHDVNYERISILLICLWCNFESIKLFDSERNISKFNSLNMPRSVFAFLFKLFQQKWYLHRESISYEIH